MADNVAITAGTGPTVATDDVGGVHYQKVKLSIGADDTANPLAVGAGAVDTGTPRMTLASDDPAVARIGALDATKVTDPDAASAALNALARGMLSYLQTVATVGVTMLDGNSDPINPVAPGAAAVSASSPVTIATDEPTIYLDYETVAASQTDQMLGATGAAGDSLHGLLVIPATTSPGAVSIEDGSTNTTVFTGGASSVSNLVPFFIPLNNIKTASGGWEITTGANVSVIAFGQFT